MTQSGALSQNINLLKNEGITIIFDFDNTLVETNEKNDKETLFLNISVERFIDNTFRIFNQVKDSGYNHLFIVTARHPITIPKIAKILDFNEKNIIARDYCLSKEEMEIALSTLENDQEFMDASFNFKANTYNNFAKGSRLVMVFDDHSEFIYQRPQLSPKVIILEPI